jgi:hypothetical protein
MATAATSLLGLALPVTGELSGTWGDTVNVSITALLDTAVAGTTTLSSDSDVTLTTTTLAANQARQAIILWTAGGTVTRTITVPAQSKSYIVINKTSSSQSIKIVGAGPTTGVTIVAGTAAFVVWNGVDFVTASVTSTTGILPVANGGTGLASGTSGGVLAYTATGTLASSAALAANALVIGGGAGAAPSTTTTGTGVVTALGVNTGTAGAFVVNGGALGTPSSGTVTNLTGTASININGTVGATTPTTGAFTTLSATGTITSTSPTVVLRNNSAGTTYKECDIGNTGNTLLWGVEGSPIQLVTGATGYDAFINTNSGTGLVTSVNLTKVTRVDSTGLAVTGTLSATGDITSTGAIKANLNGSNAYAILQADSSGAAGGKIWTLASNATGSPIGTAGGLSVRSSTDSITVAIFTSTGLAVTGTLSATNLISSTFDGAGNPWLSRTGATVNAQFIAQGNTGGIVYAGIEPTAGGNIITGSTSYAFAFRSPSTPIQFSANGGTSPQMTLDSSGNLGIGTTTPQAILDVSRDAEILIQAQCTGATGAGFLRFKNGGGNYYMGPDSSTGNRGFATGGAAYGLVISTESANPICFGTTNTERARIDSSGNLLVGVATANANGGVLQLKSGITFPATAVASTDANTLDDYEEGTFTLSSNFTITGALTQSNAYVMIGRQVTLNYNFNAATSIVCTAGASFLNLPPFETAYDGTCLAANLATDLGIGVGAVENSAGATYILPPSFTSGANQHISVTTTYFV